MNIINSNNVYLEKIFKEITFREDTIRKAEFNKCKFINCNMLEKDFDQCMFEECVFIDSNLSNIKLNFTKIAETTFEGCKIIGVDWTALRKDLGIGINFSNCDLSYCYFADIDLSNITFKKCILIETDFTNTNLSNASFEESDLLKSKFFGTNLQNADFRTAVNYFIDLKNNKCEKAKFSYPEVLNLLSAAGIIVE